MVVLGSVVVTNIVALTGAHSASAVAARNALATVLQSGDVTAIYGSRLWHCDSQWHLINHNQQPKSVSLGTHPVLINLLSWSTVPPSTWYDPYS